LIRHINAYFSGSYFALPDPVAYTLQFSVFLGTGIFTTTFVAKFVESKIDFTFTLYSILYFPYSCTTGITLKGRLMFSVIR